MRGDPKIIEALNECLTAELTAINQYMVHSEMCANWGYKKLYKQIRGEAIQDRRRALDLPVGRDGVRPESVDHDEQDGGPLCWSATSASEHRHPREGSA